MSAATRQPVSACRRARALSGVSTRLTRTSSPLRNVAPSARNAEAAQSHATMSSAPRRSRPNSRMPACSSMTSAMPARETAAATAAAAYRQSRKRLVLFAATVSLDELITFGAGLLQPLGENLVTDLGKRAFHRRIGLAHCHAVLRQRLVRLALALLRHVPATLLGGGRRFAQRVLLFFRQPLPGARVDHDGRSEERRVGEECRSRWSPDH